MEEQYKQKLHEIIERIIRQGASDLHIAEKRKPFMRVNGRLVPLDDYSEMEKIEVKGILDFMLKEEFEFLFAKNKQVDFSYEYKNLIRFRGNGFIQQGKIGIVMRLIPNKVKRIDELNLPQILESFSRKSQGFFLVVGPVGQGKSTTLASMINLINHERS